MSIESRPEIPQADPKGNHLAHKDESDAAIAGSLSHTGLVLPSNQTQVEHFFHQYVLRIPHHDALRAHLRTQGIGTLVHYPQTVHQQTAYWDRLLTSRALAQTEHATAQVLRLPVHPELTVKQVSLVADAICDWSARLPERRT